MISNKLKITLTLMLCFFYQIGESQTLQEYKNEAIQNNPEIKMLEQQVLIDKEKVHEVGGLPNTKISAGYFVSEPETRTGPQKARFSATQPLPWFGTIKARKETVNAYTEVVKNKLEIIKRKIILQVETAYYTLYELKAKERVLVKQDTLINTYIEIALKEVENDKASAVDILKLNIARNAVQQKQEELKGVILTTENTLNQLLHRDGFDPLYIPDNLYIPDEEPTLLLEDIDYHPELLNFDYVQEVLDKKETVNQKDKSPSLGIGLDYVIVDERSDIELIDNGKDIIMPMVSLSIPLFSKKHSSRSKQYQLQKEETSYHREKVQNKLENILEKAMNNRITARIGYDTQQKNIEQVQKAEKIVLSSYQVAQVDFSELLDIQKMLLDFEQKKLEAIANYFKQSAILNYLQ